jgi:glycosyltransferase involved in cell wall biosynthesis
MEKIINYSVIIPHKNTPRLLERCVNSIPQREDIEIIIVDDNSSSDIVDFSKFPCTNVPNVKVIFNKDAKGAGHARNIALPLAVGKWIIFADSDDFFNPCFNDILNDYINSTDDIIYFNANSVDSTTLRPSNRVDHLHDFFQIYHRDKKEGEKQFRYLFSEPWCKICRRTMIINNHIKFEETIIDEDVFFSYNAGYNAKGVHIDDREAYCVTSRENSLSQITSEEKLFCRFKIAAEWNKFLLDNNINLEIKNFTYMLYNFSRKLYKDNRSFRKEYFALRSIGYKRFYLWHIIGKNIMLTAKLKIHNVINLNK